MDLFSHFQMLARYNRIANERLYEKSSELSDREYHMNRAGSFGSIHALLNQILRGDRIWMSRFEGGGRRANRIILQETARGVCRTIVRLHQQSGKDLCGGRARSIQPLLQSPDTPSRTGSRDAEPDRDRSAVARPASHHQPVICYRTRSPSRGLLVGIPCRAPSALKRLRTYA